MPEPYTIEPPVERQRELTRDRKLDRIIDLLSPKHEEPTDDGSPEVTFEPEPDQLPTVDELPKEDGEESGAEGQGEGTANVADGREQRSGFRFPGAKRTGGMPR